MDDLCTGTITKITDGKFDGQYNVEITLPNGSKFNGYDGISVYEKKQDGSPSKVWPMVERSKFESTPYLWKANVKESDTKGGTKLYATIVWAEPADENSAGEEPDGRGSHPATPASPAGTRTERSSNGSAANKDEYWARREAQDEKRQLEIEAAWAVKAILDRTPSAETVSDQKLVQDAIRLVIVKRQVASELAT